MLRILLIEDSPTYTRGVQCALARCENLPPEVKTVDSVRAAFLSVEEAPPDVIVLDCSLRESIGLGAVHEIRALAPGIPIVALVPIGKENLAQQIARTGAEACVFTSDMDSGHLIPAIRRAIDTVECERIEFLPVRKREEVPLLFDEISEGLVTTDPQGECAYCNPAAVQMLGYRSPEDLLGKNLYCLVRGIRSQSYRLRSPESEYHIENVIRTGLPVHMDTEIFWRADGTPFLAEYFASPLRRSDRIVGIVTVFRDISHLRIADDEIPASRARFIRHAHRLIKIATAWTPEEPNRLRENDRLNLLQEEMRWHLRSRAAYSPRGQ